MSETMQAIVFIIGIVVAIVAAYFSAKDCYDMKSKQPRKDGQERRKQSRGKYSRGEIIE